MQLTGLPPVLVVEIFSIFPSMRATATTLHIIFSCLLPHYGVGGASIFMQIQYIENKIKVLMGQEPESYFANSKIQITLAAYAVMIPVYLGLLVLLDRRAHRSAPAGSPPHSLSMLPPTAPDPDVAAEADDVARGFEAAGGGGGGGGGGGAGVHSVAARGIGKSWTAGGAATLLAFPLLFY